MHLVPAPSTGNWVMVEALSAAVSAGVLLVGGVVAAMYGRKVNPSVDAGAHLRPDGHVVLTVRSTIASPGVVAVRIPEMPGHVPVVTVTEVLQGKDGLHDGAVYPGSPLFDGRETVGGGEMVARTELFFMPPPTPNLVGWRAEFFVDVRRFAKRWQWWTWGATTFVRAPEID
ncbi:MAG: hypothetical protein ACRDZR_03040 [Acidimicrobiales bacterium]